MSRQALPQVLPEESVEYILINARHALERLLDKASDDEDKVTIGRFVSTIILLEDAAFARGA